MPRRGQALSMIAMLWVLFACFLSPVASHAGDFDADEIARLFPDESGKLTSSDLAGAPRAIAVSANGNLIGYAFSTLEVSGSIGYGGKPIDIHVGLRVDGRIASAHLVAHEEPILVIGIAPKELESFVRGLAGIDIRQPLSALSRRPGIPDHVTGATISSTVIKDAVLRSARTVVNAHALLGDTTSGRRLDIATYAPKSWRELAAEGAIAHRRISNADAGVAASANALPASTFLDLYVALLTPPVIGQNLLGQRAFEHLQSQLATAGHAILVAADGGYSFKGTAWRQTGTFDRLQIEQGAQTIKLHAADHDNVERVLPDDAPPLREIGLFRIPTSSGFDPTKPWRLSLAINGVSTARPPSQTLMTLDYVLPDGFFQKAAAPVRSAAPAPAVVATPPLQLPQSQEVWIEVWKSRKLEIAIAAAMLAVLAVILFAHDILVRNVQRYRVTRLVFLATTVMFLGFYSGTQLSVVHVVTFSHAVLEGFKWDQFLLDPLAFVLWSFVALCLLFWGRGVFCGWLCPFGALQELLNEVARRLGIKQIEVPWSLHERLWPIKYVAFLLILGVSFRSTTQAFQYAEIEPFKTAIALKFMRAWPYLAYVAVLLGAGLFIERFYCRYLCPLGAALAIPARLRLFEWLKRRQQCGRECRICAARCTVQAINPLGVIVPNECVYCLQCQVNYYDARTCLPLIQRAQRRASRPTASKPSASKPGAQEGQHG